MNQLQMAAPCLFGVEGILASELRRMDARDITPENGRVLFAGGPEMLARVNIGSRFAERVHVVLGTFTALSFDALFEGTKALPWEQFIGKTDAFPVKGWSLNSKLFSVPDCQAIVKKAVVERLKSKYRVPWFEETGAVCRIQFSILKDSVSLMIDTSGEGLHKRGYRSVSNDAPLKETLAAAIADIARVRGFSHVVDPFCGSGTLLIESALMAMRIAPGLKRSFAAEKWSSLPKAVWQAERERALSLIIRENTFDAVGSDPDGDALRIAESNTKKAGVDGRVRYRQHGIDTFIPDGDSGVVLCNPPYGERLLDIQAAEGLYREMGRRFVPKAGWSYYIITPHEEFETLFGRKADKRRKLYNGMIKCQLYMYFKA